MTLLAKGAELTEPLNAEEGNINAPTDLAIDNQTDRFILDLDAIDHNPRLQGKGAHAKEELGDRQIACRRHAYEYRIDSLEIARWKWSYLGGRQ